MATLTEAAVFGRKALRWVVLGSLAIFLLLILVVFGNVLKGELFPSKPPPPTVAFGKLPRLDLSGPTKAPALVVYRLETITGNLPLLPSAAKVLAIAPAESSFGALGKARVKAARVGFEKEPAITASGLVKFNDPKNQDRVLTMEIASGNFVLASDYLNNPEIISSQPRNTEEAIDAAYNFFINFDLPVADFPKDKALTQKYRVTGSSLTEILALSQANLIKVTFGRVDLDQLPVIPATEKMQVWALVSAKGVVAANMQVPKIEKFKFATYPLKGTVAAFEDLKAGKGIFNGNLKDSEFVIRDVTLAYLLVENSQFLQPVYVFKGDNNINAYIPAVDNEWLE